MKYRPEIDGLRAVAVLPVIFFHAGFSVFSGGFAGVDVFFVISGYLITSILISELEQGKFSIARFYERRARRILPPLFTVMFACLPFAYMWMLPSQLKDFAQSLVAIVFFASNVLFWKEDGYFAAAAELKPLLHTWSLAVEEQYYLLFPIFLLVLWRFGRRRMLMGVAAIAVLSLLLAEWGWRNSPSANFYLAPMRAWELLAGSICAFMTVGGAQRSSNILSALGLTLVVFSIFEFNASTPFPSVYTLLPVVGTALVILFTAEGTWVARLLGCRAFVGIGLISYSAYLWHQPLFAFARMRSLTEPSNVLMAALAAASMLLAWATWYWIEQPFRKCANPLLVKRRSVFIASGAIGAMFVVVGLAGHFGKGFEWRLDDAELRLYSTATPSPMRSMCHYGRNDNLGDFDFCTYFGDEAHIAIYGNSHAVELAYGLAEVLSRSSQSIAHFIISGCPPGFRIELESNCMNFYNDRLNYIISNQQISHVVLTYRAEGASINEAASIVDLANFLIEKKGNVTLVLQAPTLQRDISFYLKHSFLTGQSDVAARARDEWLEINSVVYGALESIDGSVRVIDLADYFCDVLSCYAVRNGTALYFDDNHMSIYGARLVAEDIVQMLE